MHRREKAHDDADHLALIKILRGGVTAAVKKKARHFPLRTYPDHENALRAETLARPFKQASGLPLRIFPSIADEDARDLELT
jgi:hypothetical protein